MRQTLQTLLTYGRERLKRRGSPEPELDAKYLLLEAFRTDTAHFLMNRCRELPDNEPVREMTARYKEMIAQREKRIPLQQILGTQEFMGLTFLVNRHVLIPRQDTETLVELVLNEHSGQGETILDLCTGSGCIAVSLAVLGNYGQIIAADISKEALKVAEKNAKRLLEGRKQSQIYFLEGDLFEAVKAVSDVNLAAQIDILVSNPPYIPSQEIEGLEPEVRDYEPRIALDGREDGLDFYRRIALDGRTYLRQGASVYLEIGYNQGDEVKKILEEAGFVSVRIIKDACKKDRVAAAKWL